MQQSNQTPSYFFPAVIVLALLFFLFAYNSGFGYDALEYLNIGRGLTEGRHLYDYVPSKSPWYYGYVSCWFFLFHNLNHVTLSVVITIQFLAVGLTAYWVVKQLYHTKTAAFSSILLLICCFLTEMNFMEPEIPLVVFIILAFGFLIKYLQDDKRTYLVFISGLLLGCACMIKATALFALVAFGIILLMRAVTRKEVLKGIANALILALAFGIIILGTWLYFVQQGYGEQFMFWTFIFPLKYYPGDHDYLVKSLIKLSPVFIVVFFGLYRYFSGNIKYSVNEKILVNNSLAVGLFMSLALMKSQASHYFFPTLFFLLMPFAVYIASVKVPVRYFIAVAGVVVVFTIAVSFYRPDALQRFIALKDFAEEQALPNELKSLHVYATQKGIILDNIRLNNYLLHPAYGTALISDDAQDGYYLAHHPQNILEPLQSKTAVYVIFKKENWALKNVSFSNTENSRTLQLVIETLQKNYTPIVLKSTNESLLWVRK